VTSRKAAREALTGAHAGRVLSRVILKNQKIRVPTPYLKAEGNTNRCAIASTRDARFADSLGVSGESKLTKMRKSFSEKLTVSYPPGGVGKLGWFSMTTHCECKTEITKFRLASDEHTNRTCALDSVGLFP
jgi:hypothetical protein